MFSNRSSGDKVCHGYGDTFFFKIFSQERAVNEFQIVSDSSSFFEAECLEIGLYLLPIQLETA